MAHREAEIVINGVPLTDAQSMTLRVAVTNFAMELAEPEHLEALGPIGPLYRERLDELQHIIVDPLNDSGKTR